MSKSKEYHGVWMGISVLPALIICAANAEDITFARGEHLGAYYMLDSDTLSHADQLRPGEDMTASHATDGTVSIQASGYNSDPGSNSDYGAFYVYINNTRDLVLADSRFANNSGTMAAGASIWTHGGKESATKIYIRNSEFINNIGTGNNAAGAILFAPESDFVFLGDAELSNVTFNGNRAINGMGGAIQDQNHNVVISDSIFKNNVAKNGGAIYLDNHDITAKMENVAFENNSASGQGGAIYNAGTNILELCGENTFSGNSAGAGADIFNNGLVTIAGGTTTIDGGIDGAGTLDIAAGATLNIGDAMIAQSAINLDGDMIANLARHGEMGIFTADKFTGAGNISLIAKTAGEYKVFGNAVFGKSDDINIESILYDLEWISDTTIKATLKPVDEIADKTGLSGAPLQTVVNIASAGSDKLNELGMLVQTQLATGDVAVVEKVHKVIHPEEVPAVHAVASNVLGTVTKLAANRMNVSSFAGRSGGDVDLTAGGVWAQGLFNKTKLNDQFHGYTRGVAAGIDGTVNRVFTIGAGYAFNHSDLSLKYHDTEIDSNAIFVYGQYKPSQWYANAILNYTMSDYTEKGSVLGVEIKSDYKINSFGGQVMTGYDMVNGITPEVGLRYLHVDGDTYTNNLDIRNRIKDADFLTGIIGAKYGNDFWITRAMAIRPEVRAAAKYDIITDDAVTSVAMPGVNAYSINGHRLKRFGGDAGVGVTLSYRALDISVTYDIEVRKDYTSQTGMVKARYNF